MAWKQAISGTPFGGRGGHAVSLYPPLSMTRELLNRLDRQPVRSCGLRQSHCPLVPHLE